MPSLAQKLVAAFIAVGGNGARLNVTAARRVFEAAMDTDLDTTAAQAALAQLAEEVVEAVQAGREVRSAQDTIRTFGRVFGLRLDAAEPETRVIAGWAEHLARFE